MFSSRMRNNSFSSNTCSSTQSHGSKTEGDLYASSGSFVHIYLWGSLYMSSRGGGLLQSFMILAFNLLAMQPWTLVDKWKIWTYMVLVLVPGDSSAWFEKIWILLHSSMRTAAHLMVSQAHAESTSLVQPLPPYPSLLSSVYWSGTLNVSFAYQAHAISCHI